VTCDDSDIGINVGIIFGRGQRFYFDLSFVNICIYIYLSKFRFAFHMDISFV